MDPSERGRYVTDKRFMKSGGIFQPSAHYAQLLKCVNDLLNFAARLSIALSRLVESQLQKSSDM